VESVNTRPHLSVPPRCCHSVTAAALPLPYPMLMGVVRSEGGVTTVKLW
jgi:hypothetical protein